MENPKFLLTVDQKQYLKIILETPENNAVGFYVFNTKDGHKTEDMAFVSPFVSGQTLGLVTSFKDIELDAGRYIVMPATFNPNIHVNFTLHVLADKKACRLTNL